MSVFAHRNSLVLLSVSMIDCGHGRYLRPKSTLMIIKVIMQPNADDNKSHHAAICTAHTCTVAINRAMVIYFLIVRVYLHEHLYMRFINRWPASLSYVWKGHGSFGSHNIPFINSIRPIYYNWHEPFQTKSDGVRQRSNLPCCKWKGIPWLTVFLFYFIIIHFFILMF